MTPDEPTDGAEPKPSSLIARAGDVLARQLAKPLAPGLYVVATPIGNLGDITLRALATLASVDLVYCEDTRRSRSLFQHFGIDRRLRPYHDHNADEARPAVLAGLAAGQRIALVSDAGTPLVSDPGFKLVREAIAAGHPVTALPGPSAVLTAVAIAGLPTDCFLFAGFLPPKTAGRTARLEILKSLDATLIFFETGPRLIDTLRDMRDVLGARPAVVARELTKLHEEAQRGSLTELADRDLITLGEIVIVVGPPVAVDVTDAMIVERLAGTDPGLSVRDRARFVADSLAVPKNRVYALAIKSRT
jgi:16S rRNA (cytidine1402-2'-O)-methyltransferase